MEHSRCRAWSLRAGPRRTPGPGWIESPGSRSIAMSSTGDTWLTRSAKLSMAVRGPSCFRHSTKDSACRCSKRCLPVSWSSRRTADRCRRSSEMPASSWIPWMSPRGQRRLREWPATPRGSPGWRARVSSAPPHSHGTGRPPNSAARISTLLHGEGSADVRIAIDSRELVGRPTGVGRYLSQLLSAWGDLPAAAGHEFVLCSPETLNHASFGHLDASDRVAPGSGTLWEQRVLPRLAAAAGADVLFSPAYTCPIRCSIPVVLVIHDVSFAAHPEWFSWREGLRRRTLTRLGARRAARVITESAFSKREITRLLGIASSRIEVIYLGASALHQIASASSRLPLVLYVGSIFNRRHIPELIEGF